MIVKCEAMVEAGSNHQATEGNEAPKGDDSSGKTIEFLRARLLAERATSKSARQQAQEIAEKVKDLHTRLETEIEHRKEAEAAMRKVFLVLKAKGVAVDASNLLASRDSNGQPMGEVPPSAYVEDTDEVSEKLTNSIGDVCRKEEVSVGNRNTDTHKGIVKCTSLSTTELHGNLSVVNNTCSASDGVGTNLAGKNGDVFVTNFLEHQHCPMDKVQDADLEEKVVCPDRKDLLRCIPITKKDDGETGQSIEQGLCITSKLRAMLQQIEEEVGALPEEQPLRDKLKGWVDHAANMLDGDKGAAATGGLETHQVTQPHVNCPSEGVTKNVIHTKMAIQSKYADAFHVNEAERNPLNQMHDIARGVDRRGGLVKSLFPAPKAQPQQRHLVPSNSIPTTPTREDKLLHGNMSLQSKPPCESLNGGNMAVAACVVQCQGPLRPQMFQYAKPIHISRGNYMGSESSYLVEVPSPKSSDALSVGNKTHGQHHEFWSPARASELEGQNAWSPARLQSQPQAMLSKGYLMDELSSELPMKRDRGYTPQNIYFQDGHSFSRSTYSHQTGDVRNYNRCMAMKQPKDRFPFDDVALSVMDERLGSILMALDAARQHIQDDEVIGPPTPTSAEARLKRGYGYGGHRCVQLPPPVQSSHTPIIQFPPSPTSEHGYQNFPFERPCSAHRRSSSVSTNFMMSEWNYDLQPRRGEVHLGNGITLFTD